MIDLHLHSTASDGTYSPEDLALLAFKKGLSAIALTDHDTLQGIEVCQQAGKALGLKVLPGIELSTSYEGIELHILGYYVSSTYSPFLEKLALFKEERYLRNQVILQRLQALGLGITFEDLSTRDPKNSVLTRAHFANALLHKGYVDYTQQAFDRYLGKGKAAYVPKKLLESHECIQLIHDAGGVAILAHPTLYKLNRKQIFGLIQKLMSKGLDGVECYYPSYTPTQTKDFLNFCQSNKLLITGGSDFHGSNKPKLDLGVGYGQLAIPDELLGQFSSFYRD